MKTIRRRLARQRRKYGTILPNRSNRAWLVPAESYHHACLQAKEVSLQPGNRMVVNVLRNPANGMGWMLTLTYREHPKAQAAYLTGTRLFQLSQAQD